MKLILSLWILFLPLIVCSQTATDTSLMDQIVITDSKVLKPAKRSTNNVQIISSEEILKSGALTLDEVLDKQIGISVNGSLSNPAKDKIIYTQGVDSDFTLFLINGQQVSDPSSIGGSYDIRLLDLSQISRIEILKGNQSVLYGSDAAAGVINIITNEASESMDFNAGLNYGSWNTIHTNLGLNGKSNKFGYRLSGNYMTSDGISEAEDQLGSNDFDDDGYDKLSYGGSLSYEINDSFTIETFAHNQDWTSMYDDGSFTDGTSTYDASSLRFGGKLKYDSDDTYGEFNLIG